MPRGPKQPEIVWEVFEAAQQVDQIEVKFFSSTLAKQGSRDLSDSIGKMQHLQEFGWPRALNEWHQGGSYKKRIVSKDDKVFLLKCTPRCGRLYFYVEEPRFVFLHAVCKFQDAEDPKDARRAREIYDLLHTTGSGGVITPFKFPPG